jgi:hypothetical protein
MAIGHFMADLETGDTSAAPTKGAAKAIDISFAPIVISELNISRLGRRKGSTLIRDELVVFHLLFICGREEAFPRIGGTRYL